MFFYYISDISAHRSEVFISGLIKITARTLIIPKMKKFLILFVLAFTTNHMHAQWNEIPGLYLESEYVGMEAKQIVTDGDLLFAIIENTVYLSYNNGKSCSQELLLEVSSNPVIVAERGPTQRSKR